MRIVLTAILALTVGASVAQAMFALLPAERIDEVPVERLLANVERNAQGLTPAQQTRAIGRLHLLAYLRQRETLAVYRDRPGDVAEGRIDDCLKLSRESLTSKSHGDRKSNGELCEAREYHLGPRREIPFVANAPLPNAHLAAATAAYQRAKELEPDNLRTRLALAFAFDCARRWEDARGELRFVVRQGLRLVPLSDNPGQPKTEWETHVVLSEAVAHFERIADRDDDRTQTAELKHRLELAPPLMYITPIFVPLVAKAEMSTLIDRKSKVTFDFSGQGERAQLGWLTDKAAWLVWDPRHTGRIDSGFQMFGSVTWIAFWENGYLPLGALDDNGDGKISGDELNGLSLWRDTNANGISDPGEVKPLADYKVVALRYAYERAGDDMWIAKDGVEFADGAVRPTYDWLLHEAKNRLVGN